MTLSGELRRRPIPGGPLIDTSRGQIACECGHEVANHDDGARPGYPDGGRCQVMVSQVGAPGPPAGYEQCPCTAVRILTPEIRTWLEWARRVAAIIPDLLDEEPCHFDHHGGCQAHGYLDLKGERCPMAQGKGLSTEIPS